MNIITGFDDLDGNYARHAAVIILSLLERDKRYKVQIYVSSSNLIQENINGLKRVNFIFFST